MAMERKQQIIAWVTVSVMLFSVLGLSLVVILAGMAKNVADCKAPESLTTFAGSPSDQWPVTDLPEIDELIVRDLRPGEGKTAEEGNCIVVHYRLAGADGTPVPGEDTFVSQIPFARVLRSDQLIEGWVEGVVGMQVGGLRRIYVPADMAYGSTALIFEVELIDLPDW